MGFLDANKRPLRSHEFIGHFSNQQNKSTYNPQKPQGTPYGKVRRATRMLHYGKHRGTSTNCEDGLRFPISVLTGFYDKDRHNSKTSGKSRHPTQKP